MQPKPVRTIALMNQKGGVGKTTTTVNLAAAFAQAGRPTVVVDLDPQAHATLHLGADPATLQRSVYDVLLNPTEDPVASIIEAKPNLGLLPAVTDLAAAEIELAAEPDRLQRLDKAIAALGGRYEFVLIDCPPSLGLLTLNGLTAAREVLIPMQAHFLALQGVGKLLETVRLVTRSTNPRLVVSGVVLCMHDPASTHVREVVSDMEKFFEDGRLVESPWRFARVMRPPIRRNIKLAECPSFGQTVFEYAPQAPGAEDYRTLGTQMLREWDALMSKREGGDVGAVVTRTTDTARVS
jgi:chromosome partitioning protein